MIMIEKTICIDIDIDDIIATGELTHSSSWNEVRYAVRDWVAGLDDCDYYNLDSDDINTICTAVGNQVFTEEDNEIGAKKEEKK